ncbi:unnamed protein product [Rangifer tarandus platyrhynchus]|uniref:Uncharacterized protein n=1 Tax=Rangifer tarandus platyrhynchus TaxID=3082113 RepID=A0AC59ZLA0_RANTA
MKSESWQAENPEARQAGPIPFQQDRTKGSDIKPPAATATTTLLARASEGPHDPPSLSSSPSTMSPASSVLSASSLKPFGAAPLCSAVLIAQQTL